MTTPHAKQVETVKEKGAKAYRDGLAIDACPYVIQSKQGRKFRRIWLAGYYEARGDTFTTKTVQYQFENGSEKAKIYEFQILRNGKPFNLEEMRDEHDAS